MALSGTAGRVRIHGPLEEYVPGFEAVLLRSGFTPASVVNQLHLVAHLSRWLESSGVDLRDLTGVQVDAFLRERRGTHTSLFTRRALRHLLGWLAEAGVITPAAALPAPPEMPAVLRRFERYLLAERRIQPATTGAYVSRVHRFLTTHASSSRLADVSAGDVVRALLAEGETRAPASVKKFSSALRAFFRFCLVTGELDHDLTGATLVTRQCLPSLLPMGAKPAQIQALLAACDRQSTAGRRDYAVVLLLARLGLRAGEVAGLRLEDIDWHQGEILIRGKGSTEERLPLPVDVGDAVADYLAHARPADAMHREVFCALSAPRRRLTSPSVWILVTRACTRAGIDPFGPHKLRHGLAEQMVAAEVSLAAIGQVLRHVDPATTANYARVDVARLRTLAQSWPAAGDVS
jgi:site-specific recombinase XerD